MEPVIVSLFIVAIVLIIVYYVKLRKLNDRARQVMLNLNNGNPAEYRSHNVNLARHLLKEEGFSTRLAKLIGVSPGAITVDGTDFSGITSFIIRVGDKTISNFKMAPFPGCCGLMISFNANVSMTCQNRGIGTLLNELRVALAKRMGYTGLICTDVRDNTPQRKIMAKNGWQDIYTFRNSRTNNSVVISIKNLLKECKPLTELELAQSPQLQPEQVVVRQLLRELEGYPGRQHSTICRIAEVDSSQQPSLQNEEEPEPLIANTRDYPG